MVRLTEAQTDRWRENELDECNEELAALEDELVHIDDGMLLKFSIVQAIDDLKDKIAEVEHMSHADIERYLEESHADSMEGADDFNVDT